MWTISKRFTFEAAHQLPHHDGKCQRLHGHSWGLVVTLASDELEDDGPKRGMVFDYADIKREVKPMLDVYLDHHYLNDTLDMENPTSEAVARWIYGALRDRLPYLKSVTVEETCTSACEYRR